MVQLRKVLSLTTTGTPLFEHVYETSPHVSFALSSYENPITGSNHHDELAGMFLVPRFEDPSVNTLFSDMRQYWTNFVTTGIPTADNATKWEVRPSKSSLYHSYPMLT